MEGNMELGGSLWRRLKHTGELLYRSLQIALYWVWRVVGRTRVRSSRWWLGMGQRKRLNSLGEHVYKLHSEGLAQMPEEDELQELLRLLDSGAQKSRELEARSQELDDRYRKRVEGIRKTSAPQQAETEAEGSVPED